MNQVNRLIFNALASRSGVNMPGLGALVAEKKPTVLKGRKNLTPPSYEIRYSETPMEGLPSVVDLIEKIVNDRAHSEAVYSRWLADQGVTPERIPSTIVLEGVGDIIYKSFNPAAAMEKALNPLATAPIRLTPRLTGKHITLMALIAVLVCVAAVFYFYRTPEEKQYAYSKRMARELEQRNLDRAQKGLDVVKADQIPPQEPPKEKAGQQDAEAPKAIENELAVLAPEETKPADIKTEPKAEEAAASSPEPDSKPAPPKPAAKPVAIVNGPVYHLVLGVFSTRENADKFISQFSSKDASVPCLVVNMPSGKFMVSGFASSVQSEVNARKDQLSAKYPDIWIYKLNR